MKKIWMNLIVLFTIASLLVVIVSSCKKNDDNDDNGMKGTAELNIKLLSSNLGRNINNYEAVNIDIQQVSYHVTTDTSATSGWFDLETNSGIYNLMDFMANDTLLAFDTVVEVQSIQQIRLLLGDSNTVVVDTNTYEIKTPSGQTSGLKLLVNAELEPDKSYIINVIFDPEQSVVETGNGNYLLKPVISTEVIEQ